MSTAESQTDYGMFAARIRNPECLMLSVEQSRNV